MTQVLADPQAELREALARLQALRTEEPRGAYWSSRFTVAHRAWQRAYRAWWIAGEAV